MSEEQKKAILDRFEIALHIRGLHVVLDYLDTPRSSHADGMWKEQAEMLADCPDLPPDLDVFYNKNPDWHQANMVV